MIFLPLVIMCTPIVVCFILWLLQHYRNKKYSLVPTLTATVKKGNIYMRMQNYFPPELPTVRIVEYETKDGRHPEAIVAFINGKTVPLTFDYRTIRYVKRILREASERGDFD